MNKDMLDYGTVTHGGIAIDLVDHAYYGNHPDMPNMWEAIGIARDTQAGRVRVRWQFSDDEATVAGSDPGNLPWDEQHIIAVDRI